MRFRFTRSVKMRWAAGGLLLATLAPGVIPSAAVAQTSTCATPNVLVGSNFEIDANANLKVDGASPCIDWLAGGTGTDFRTGVLHKADKLSGTGDDSFGKGTAE